MRKEDVKVGLKVVPHSKSVWMDYEKFEDYMSNQFMTIPKLFKQNGFLEVLEYDEEVNAFVLGEITEKGEDTGDFFLAEDFEPYEEETKEDKLTLLSETFSKIFNEPIKFIERTIDVAKDLVDNDFPSQKRLNRAESFYNALKVGREFMGSEIELNQDILHHLAVGQEDEVIEETEELQNSINWNTDATAIAIADCLGIDHTRDDYFNIFYDAITKRYGFDWMIEKLKKEGVV